MNNLKNTKWVAQIKADNKVDGEIIKIGITETENEKYPDLKYNIIADNKDDISTGGEKTFESAIKAIEMMYRNWETFEWLLEGII